MFNHSHSNYRLIGCLFAIGTFAACGRAPTDSPAEGITVTTSALACPTPGRSAFVLYYSTETTDYDAIIAQHPAFVVLGDMLGNATTFDPDYFHSRDSLIKVIAYIPMNYNGINTDWNPQCGSATKLPDGPCTNTSVSYDCTTLSMPARIQNAMQSGYDGIFFDETPEDNNTYVQDCATRTKAYGANKLVIMNPGDVPSASMFSNNVDIVSVEHTYNPGKDLSAIASPWRWLSVEDAIATLGTAEGNLNTFRNSTNHGYWYYATNDYGVLPTWFNQFGSFVNLTSPPTCP